MRRLLAFAIVIFEVALRRLLAFAIVIFEIALRRLLPFAIVIFEVALRRLLAFAIVIFEVALGRLLVFVLVLKGYCIEIVWIIGVIIFTVIRIRIDLSYNSFKPFGFRIKVDQSPELLPISDGVMTWARY